MAKSIVFIDTEVGVDDHKIHDIGAVRQDRAYFHSASVRNFVEFIAGAEYICGHNILHHDLKYIHDSLGYELRVTVIDTLYLSPLLFPKRPYHALLKDDKLQTEQLNDPVNDCQKAASLFYDEVNAFFDLPPKVKQIFCCLLYDHPVFDAYAGSPCLEICGNLIRDFEETNPTKYRTDLEEFIRESNYEDFYPDDHEIVFISTIHKAKGREFDTVYMMLDGNTAATDEEKRKLYVGMTRAKNALYIHCNTELFSAIAIPEIEYIEDQNCYEEPTELTLQLTHRDVVLDFFKGKKELLLKLRSGMALSLIDCYLLAKLNGKTVRIAKLSKACKDRIESLLSKGYCPVSAEIRFIVAWKKEGDADETPVVLPDIHFQKELSIK